MGFQYLKNAPLDRAKSEYLSALAAAGFSADTERVSVTEACGRVTAEAVYAHISAPHYAASAMDGAAVHARDTFGATETTPRTIPAGRFVFLDTGDPVPDDMDAVIMIEEIETNADGGIVLREAATPWQHIRQIGEDICAGEMILPSYTKITPAAIGAMIAGGIGTVTVLKKPVIGIIPTGDEIVPPCSDPKKGEILEFNTSIFSAMLASWGAETKTYPIVPDRREALHAALVRALGACDMVLVNAGSSAGREDYSAEVIGSVGTVLFHGISIKPGKPAILGLAGQKPVVGIPGYPVSGILVLEELVRPVLEAWFHRIEPKRRSAEAVLTRPVVSGLKYEEFVRVRMGFVNGRLTASPLNRGSGVITSFLKADGLLRIPQGCEGYGAGERVKVELLCDEEKLRNTLVVIGSHDPLLDELADLLHRNDNRLYLSGTHVGSMGGLMAIRRGEAHAGGCHLLDVETGLYNRSFLRKYFPAGDVKLVSCVGRTQGLMLAHGNPIGITGIADLTRDGVRYVNRQKGSGTRILIDYLLGREGISPESVYGYEREELTHTSVAAQIASGSADAGMGIYSAAKLYGLDFLPICTEEYDLVIPDSAWDTPQVRALIEALKSEQFARRISEMGGYTLDRPGELIDYMGTDA